MAEAEEPAPASAEAAAPSEGATVERPPLPGPLLGQRRPSTTNERRPSLSERRPSLGKRRPSALRLDCSKAITVPVDPAEGPPRSLEEYNLLKSLGQGTTGVVYEATHKESGQCVALKVMRMHDEELLKTARTEYELLRSIRHPHIIRALDFFTYPRGAVLVLEHFHGSTLETAIQDSPDKRFEERCAQRLFCALVQAVHHLHAQGIIHRDVKAENLLVSADMQDLRLVDFNTARHLVEGALTMTGTADYMPPEVLLGTSLTEGSDVWAMGICLHLMLTGTVPLKRRGFQSHEDFGRSLLGARADTEGLSLSASCLEVLQVCLTIDPEKRPGTPALLDYAWLTEAAAAAAAAAS